VTAAPTQVSALRCGNVPRVSVVVAFLNGEPYLKEAIESVLRQTYADWEVLLVDDGSTDLSPGTARGVADRWPGRVRLFTHPGRENRGLSASRNLGIQHARGDYVAFLDADDVWLPNMLSLQVAALDAHPKVGMVYAATQWWYGWTGDPADVRRDFILDPRVPAGVEHPPPTLLPTFLHDGGITPCSCSILVRRELAQRVGGFEARFRDLYEDQVFYTKVCLTTSVLRLDACVARYRQHRQSMCASAPVDRVVARRMYLDWVREHLRAMGTVDYAVREALRKEYRKLSSPLKDPMLAFANRMCPVARRIVRPYMRGSKALTMRAWRAPVLRQLRALYFRRLTPMHRGLPPGTRIVRYYWHQFLERHWDAIRGRALEIGSTDTIRQYGGDDMMSAEALDVTRHNRDVTLVTDLSRADAVPGHQFDCFVLQFTLHLIAEVEAALYHSVRLLKPGGTLLANFSCVDYQFPSGLDMGTGTTLWVHWCFTPLQVHNLLRRIGLSPDDYELEVYGNLLTRIAYQLCVPAEELTLDELEYRDPGHPALICVRVTRPADWDVLTPTYRDTWVPDAVPHRYNSETGFYPDIECYWRQSRRAFFQLRAARIALFDGAAWGALIKSIRPFMTMFTARPPGRVGQDSRFVRIRSYSIRALQSKTGTIEPDQIVCIPRVHKEGHCLFGGDYLVLEDGHYKATYEMAIDAYATAQDPLVVLDVYENRLTRTVLAEREVKIADLAGNRRLFSIDFFALKGQRIEFRTYWTGQCSLTIAGILLRKVRESAG
jgi:glycosyltransferase involved in cell wall biosynthesis